MSSALSKLNYITVGPGGTFKPWGNPDILTTPDDADSIFAYLKANSKKKLLLYFHGGLVNEASGMQTAVGVTAELVTGTDVHPVSFIWETGVLETICQNYRTIWGTAFFQKLLEKIIKVAGEKLGISVETLTGTRGVGNLTYAEINIELDKAAPFNDYSVDYGARAVSMPSTNDRFLRDGIESRIEEELLSDPYFRSDPTAAMSGAELEMIDPEKLLNQPKPGARSVLSVAGLIKASVTIIYKVIKRFLAHRDHGFYPTIIEELLREIYVADAGTWAWGEMKAKAKAMWDPDGDTTGPLDRHAGHYFLNRLKSFAAGTDGVTVDLVGHSAGAIVICHFMNAFYSMSIQATIRNTIFMAPACRSDLFHDTFVKNNAPEGNFRMFTMSDCWESRDRCIPFIYTRSLLYMISGILEKDEYDAYILGMQRYLLDHEPYANDATLVDNIAFMNAGQHRTVFAVTAPGAVEGLQCIAEHHGGFADPAVLTLASIIYLLNHPANAE